MRFVTVPFRPVPPYATWADRLRLYDEYVTELVSANPEHFLPLGVKRRWWHFFKIEHPLTRPCP
jgi:hypothetical protein